MVDLVSGELSVIPSAGLSNSDGDPTGDLHGSSTDSVLNLAKIWSTCCLQINPESSTSTWLQDPSWL